MDLPEILLSLFFAMGCAPLGFFSSCSACCPTVACTRCASGSLPFATVTITLAGLVESGDFTPVSCGAGVGCEDLNGDVYILDLTTTNVGTCAWQRVEAGPGTCSGLINLTLSAAGFLIFSRAAGGISSSWNVNVGAAPTDCSVFVSPMVLSPSSAPYGNCDISGSTATLEF